MSDPRPQLIRVNIPVWWWVLNTVATVMVALGLFGVFAGSDNWTQIPHAAAVFILALGGFLLVASVLIVMRLAGAARRG